MTVGIVGLGLIGGSIAKALKAAEPECRVYAYMRSAARLELARGEGIVDVVLTGGGDGRIRDCDILFLCTPVEVAADYLRQLKPLLKEGAFITDVGSTKSAMEKVTLELGMGDRFIGGHPMAGSEKSGYEFSDPVLLENIFYLLCPTPDTPPATQPETAPETTAPVTPAPQNPAPVAPADPEPEPPAETVPVEPVEPEEPVESFDPGFILIGAE